MHSRTGSTTYPRGAAGAESCESPAALVRLDRPTNSVRPIRSPGAPTDRNSPRCLGWPLAWTGLFLVVTAWNLPAPWPDSRWIAFWRVWVLVVLAAAVAVTAWFTVGGIGDLRSLFGELRRGAADPADDGRTDHRRFQHPDRPGS